MLTHILHRSPNLSGSCETHKILVEKDSAYTEDSMAYSVVQSNKGCHGVP